MAAMEGQAMMWIVLLAQVGVVSPQMYRDEDGFVYSAAETHTCDLDWKSLQGARSVGRPSDDLADHRRQFHICVEQYRSQAEMELKQRAQPAAEKEAIRQYRAQKNGRTAPKMLQIDGIDYIDVEAHACWREFDALQGSVTSTGPQRGNPQAARIYHAEFEKCLDKLHDLAGREDQEEAQQKDRQGRLAREAQARQLAQQLVDKPEARRVDLSGLLCVKLASRQEVLGTLAKEKKYSAIGGVVNLGRRSQLQDELAGLDDEIRSIRSTLKGYKTTSLGCGDPKVKVISDCLSEDAPESCGTDLQVRANVLAAQMLME
jgi:hypothetical protein